MSESANTTAERIVKLPTAQGRRELNRILNASHDEQRGSPAYDLALSFSAHLCTAIRVICETRKLKSPWTESA